MRSLSIGIGIGRKRSRDWNPLNHLFALPSTGISLVVGTEVTIYGDTLVNVPISNNLQVTYTCDIGTQSGNNFTINPDAGDIGNHQLSILFKNAGKSMTQVVTLSVIPASVASNFTLLMVGDSILYLGAADIGGEINNVLTPTITFIGKQGTTIKNEGNSGASYQWYMTADLSPLRKNGVLDISAYFTDNSLPKPDFISIRLGVNDVFGWNLMPDIILEGIINYAKSLVDGFIACDSYYKIFIGLPSISENTGNGWNANYDGSLYHLDDYIKNIHLLWNALISTFDNGVYNSRVTISNEVIFLDRDEGYPKTNGVHTNGVHPDQSGNVQIGDGLAIELTKQINEANTLRFKTDQTTLNTITFQFISCGAGVVTVDWGDGTHNDYTGFNVNVTHDYSVSAAYYAITVSGAINELYYLDFHTNTSIYGDLSNWHIPLSLVDMEVNDTNISKMPRGNYGGLETMYFHNCNMTTAVIDEWLAWVHQYFTAHTPTKDIAFYLHGVNGIPTGGNNNADRLAIIALFTAAGKTATILNAT